jgi:CDP-4-dehydro-6-deoxyglucose reductase, E1
LNNSKNFLTNSNIDTNSKSIELRKKILELVVEYTQYSHNVESFIPGKSIVPVSGKVYDSTELQFLISSSLDFWLTSDRFNDEFEKQLKIFLNTNFVLTTNSGSSANLLAITALKSKELGKRTLNDGDEIITVAAAFPTTVNPIIQNNLIPVFVDVNLGTYEADMTQIEKAITDKSKAIILAHTLGNAFNIEKIKKIVNENNLWLIEDCCDALGTTYQGKHVGKFGDIGTLSFFPAHQMTMGEGGAIFTDNPTLKKIIESLRDWGRDCFCAPGQNNTCGKRFEWKLGELPEGYDHKYIYSNLGYNLKITEMQAAIGLGQIAKLSEFIKIRKSNFSYLKNKFDKFKKYLILPEPTIHSEPSWFGFPITVKENALFTKNDLVNFLSSKLIDTRPLFAGNLTKQPYFENVEYRIVENLRNTDLIMNNTFWIGVFPGLTKDMLDYVIEQFEIFFNQKLQVI